MQANNVCLLHTSLMSHILKSRLTTFFATICKFLVLNNQNISFCAKQSFAKNNKILLKLF
jgi:hypothetical protein